MMSSEVIAWRSNEPIAADNLIDIVIAQDGLNKSPIGDFVIDAEGWGHIESKFKERDGVDMVFDFDHQSMGGKYARQDGRAPAAGWIKALRYEPGRGIIASVEWTDEARTLIRSKQYRYSSGVYNIDKKTRRVMEIVSVAITNTPATRGIEPLAASERPEGVAKETDVMPKTGTKNKTLRERLQVMQEATPEDAAAIADEVVEEVDEVGVAIAELKAALGLGEDVGPVDVIKAALEKIAAPADEGGEGEDAEAAAESDALSALKERVGLDKGCKVQVLARKFDELHTTRVSGEDYKAMSDRVEVLEADKAEAARDVLVQSYVDDGKLNPNDEKQMAWANGAALADVEGFKLVMSNAVRVHEVGQLVTNDSTGPKSGRAKIIASAGKEWENTPQTRGGASKAFYVTAALRETDESDLTDAETKALVA